MSKTRIVGLAILGLCAVGTFVSTEAAEVTYEHDSRGRLTRAVYSDGTIVDYSYDFNGNRTGAAVSAPPPDTPPTAPGTPTFANITGVSARASWAAATDNIGVSGYEYRLGASNWHQAGNVLSVNLTGLSPVTSYTFQVRARDTANNVGPASTGSFTTLDSVPPSVPTGLIASAPTSNSVNLTWSAASDNVAVTGYRIFRGGAQIGTSGVTNYTDNTVSGTVAYSYRVSAYDAAGNHSEQSSAVLVTTPDTIAPNAPLNLVASAVSATQINLSWSAVTDSGGSGLAGYRVYRGGAHIGSTSSTNYTDGSVSGGTSYTYTVQAYDNANNVSTQSNTASATTPIPVPGTPGLGIQRGAQSYLFTVSWTVPSGPVAYYQLEEREDWGEAYIAVYQPPTTSVAKSGWNTYHEYRVRACNSVNQCSAWSAAAGFLACPPAGCN